MAHTLRLDLLGRTNIAVASVLDGQTRGIESFPSWDSRWKDGVRTTVRKTLRVTCVAFR